MALGLVASLAAPIAVAGSVAAGASTPPPILVLGGPADDAVHAEVTASGGGAVLVGTFAGSWTQGAPLTSHGGTDGFVVRIDPSLQVTSAAAIGGTGDDELWGAAVGADGSVVVVGDFSGSITVGGRTLVSAGGRDALVVKYDAAGNVAWVRRAGGTGDERARGVTVDGAGNVGVVGDYTGAASTWGWTSLPSAGGSDGFLARFAVDGGLWWARRVAGAGSDALAAIAAGPDGTFTGVGWSEGTASVGAGTTTQTVAGSGSVDAVAVTFARSGDLRWTAQFGGSGPDLALGVARDATGNVFVGGAFTGSATVRSSATPGTLTMSGQGTDGVLVRLDDSGHPAWVDALSGPGTDLVTSVGMRADGELDVTGAAFASIAVPCGTYFTVTSGPEGWWQTHPTGAPTGFGPVHVLGPTSGADLAWAAAAPGVAGTFAGTVDDLNAPATRTSAGGDDVYVSAGRLGQVACPIW